MTKLHVKKDGGENGVEGEDLNGLGHQANKI
jgi:hypothetical protein